MKYKKIVNKIIGTIIILAVVITIFAPNSYASALDDFINEYNVKNIESDKDLYDKILEPLNRPDLYRRNTSKFCKMG